MRTRQKRQNALKKWKIMNEKEDRRVRCYTWWDFGRKVSHKRDSESAKLNMWVLCGGAEH